MRKLNRTRTGCVLIGIAIGLIIAVRVPSSPKKAAAVHLADEPGHMAPLAAPVARPVYALSPEGHVLQSTNGAIWQSLEGFSKGRATAVAQGKGGTLYVGTESAGLFRSDDGGQTWMALTDKMSVPMPNLTVTALAMGASDNAIYVAVGYWLGIQKAHLAPLGVYVSNDGGMTWQKMIGKTPEGPIVTLEVDQNNSNLVYARIEGSETVLQYAL